MALDHRRFINLARAKSEAPINKFIIEIKHIRVTLRERLNDFKEK